jgi:hypothetical protein
MNEHYGKANWRPASGSGREWFIGILIAALVLMLLVVGNAGAAANSKSPTPYFASPLNGSTVEGTVPVIVYAPEFAQFNAELGVDGVSWQPMHSRGDGIFDMKWNSADVGSGKHTLTARFTLEFGRPPVYAVSIQVKVLNLEIPLPPEAGLLPLPCIYVEVPTGLRPAACGAPATS